MKNKKEKNSGKKPFYKKWWFWVIIVVILLIGFGNADNESNSDIDSAKLETETTTSKTKTETTISETKAKLDEETQNTESKKSKKPAKKETSPTKDMEKIIRNRITDEYTNTDIDRITLNDDLGTDKKGDYIALVYLTWNVKNSGKTSKEILSLYSEDLSAIVARDCPDIQELAIFWTVPYLNDANAKCSYERKGNGMHEMDMMWPSVFN